MGSVASVGLLCATIASTASHSCDGQSARCGTALYASHLMHMRIVNVVVSQCASEATQVIDVGSRRAYEASVTARLPASSRTAHPQTRRWCAQCAPWARGRGSCRYSRQPRTRPLSMWQCLRLRPVSVRAQRAPSRYARAGEPPPRSACSHRVPLHCTQPL